ncbi:MAG TPA: hypothetical protein VIL18_02460 [Longimicrobiales bacterium]
MMSRRGWPEWILAGGSRLYVLESEPPGAWTVSVRRYAASHR